MQKTAQKRSLLNKLREMTNVSGISAEKFFNPEFEDVMNRLRDETDDPVRAIVTGNQIGDAEAPADGLSLKSLLSSAKSNLNRREYMKSVADLGRFHKKMYDVVKILSGFRATLDSVHEKFLFKDLDDESKEHLHDLHNRFAPKAAAYNQPYFLKQANILDFFANIGTERGRALSAWEKRYPKQVAQLKKSSASMLTQSERLLSVVISVLKEMASARAVRNPDKYIAAAAKIIKAYDNYDNSFKTYYNTTVKPFENIISGFAPKKVDVSDKPAELGDQEIDTNGEVNPKPEDLDVPTLPRNNLPKNLSPQSVLSKSPSVIFPNQNVPSSGVEDLAPEEIQTIPPSSPPSATQRARDTDVSPIGNDGDTEPSPSMVNTEISPPPSSRPATSNFKADEIARQMWGTASHRNFYNALSKMSGESPVVLSLFIKKYASSIQKSDPTTAIQLLNVAKSIRG
jgi:hypothetical protein